MNIKWVYDRFVTSDARCVLRKRIKRFKKVNPALVAEQSNYFHTVGILLMILL